MPERARRKRFQIHLSTAIVMMVAAGILLWANLGRPQDIVPIAEPRARYSGDSTTVCLVSQAYGWPDVVKRYYVRTLNYKGSEPAWVGSREWRLDWWNLAEDVLIAVIILTIVWYLCERLIRRRAIRAPD